MVYHNQNYWVFGLFSLSGILGTRKHDTSETDPVSEKSCFLISRIQTMEMVQNPSNSDDKFESCFVIVKRYLNWREDINCKYLKTRTMKDVQANLYLRIFKKRTIRICEHCTDL
jgi:hypothetical protein